MTEDDVTQTEASVEQHSLVQSIVLHLLPGVLILLFYIITAPLAEKLGFPSGTALFVAIGVVLIPFELGYLLYQGRKRNGTLSLKGIVLFREPMPWWQYSNEEYVGRRGRA
jgi:inner membrane protein involved in colicin E2 resistance